MDFSKKLDDNNTLCAESPSSIFESEQQQQHHNNDRQKPQQQQLQEMDDMQSTTDRADTPSISTSGSRDVELMSKSPEDKDNNRKTEDGGDLLASTDNLLEAGLDIDGALNDGMDNVCGADNFIENTGQISPSARLLTSSSEVVGLNALLDADDDLPPLGAEQMHKSRSMPTSPENSSAAAAAAAAAATSAMLLPHMNALFDYNVGSMGDMRPPSRMLEARSKRLRDPKAESNSPAGGAGSNHQQFCLRWNNYQTNLTNVFDELLQSESFVDVTLACEGQSVKAHKMVLSACSPYFQALFFDNPCQHPIIIMRDVRWQELKAIMEFMYKGEINVSQEQIDPLLKVAEMLKIRGLAEVSSRNGARDERDVSLAAAHTMLPPEQHMSVYDDDLDDDVDEDVMRNVAAMADPRLADHDDDDDETQKVKRSRLTHCSDVLDKLPRALDLNLSGLQQRKRSRDGLLMPETEESRLQAHNSRSPTPTAKTRSSNAAEATGTPPPSAVSATASTIVRNPFASPNANNTLSEQPANSVSQAASVGNISINSMSTASELGASCANINTSGVYRQSPSLSQHSPNASRNGESASGNHIISNKNNNNNNNNNNNSNTNNNVVCSSSNSGSCEYGSSVAMSHQMPPHSHSVSAAAAAAAFSNSHLLPHQTHHHHHHAAAAAAAQLSAQHPLHASHSHAAIASALAAVAAGAGPGSGVPGQASGGSMGGPSSHHDDLEIKPEIAEMIREEERAKMIEGGHPWLSGAAGSSVADSYQYQLQSMWQKCWNTNQQNLVQQLRFRERGPLKSWRPEAMAEAIFSVLKEGLSLSQAARKYDIPYPTFVLYANRVHNMLGPSLDGGTDPRPKARGRPQRILLGMWPEELIRSVIKAVVFRDYREIKEETGHPYANGQTHISPFGTPTNPAATAAAMAANGYNNVAKLVVQNSALAPPNSPSPLSTMSESLRRQIMSQQQQSPISQTMNMYKSPAYLQRSEIEDQVSKQPSDRRGVENLPDITAMGLMGVPGLNVMPPDPSQRGSQLHGNSSAFSRERELECERSRERDRDRVHELTARSYGNQSRGGMPSNVQKQQQSKMSSSGGGSGISSSSGNISCTSTSGGPISPFSAHFKQKEHHPNYAYNKRFLESLPPGIDFEALANGLLQKSVNKSPRFEDFFAGQEINELFANASDPKSSGSGGGGGSSGSVGPGAGSTSSSSASSYAAMRDSAQLMKIKLEQQAGEIPHED